mgnify:CR=1 FL=1
MSEAVSKGGHIPDEEIKAIVAVASGKGGVGKSTTAVNLALALKALGLRVAVLDADIYGPSMPKLFGLTGKPEAADAEGKKMKPMTRFGVEVMSIGFLVEPDQALIWRGPFAALPCAMPSASDRADAGMFHTIQCSVSSVA